MAASQRKREAVGRARGAPAPAPEAQIVPLGLSAARIEELDTTARTARVVIGRGTVSATLDAAVDPVVIATAHARGERVIVQRDPGGWVVLGALRTTATPGVDVGEEFDIQARRVRITAAHEVTLATGAASLVLRAHGFVETVAQDITARASQVHKIIGRLVRLN